MREIALGAGEQRTRAVEIPAAVVVERDGDLDQALEEFLLFHGRGAPDVLPDFVGVEIVTGVEEVSAALEGGRIQWSSCRPYGTQSINYDGDPGLAPWATSVRPFGAAVEATETETETETYFPNIG